MVQYASKIIASCAIVAVVVAIGIVIITHIGCCVYFGFSGLIGIEI